MRNRWIGAVALTAALAACGGGEPPTKRAPSYAGVSTPVLWSVQRTTASQDTLARVEAELGARGETASGGAYLGQRTAEFYGSRLYPRRGSGGADRNCADFRTAAAAQRFFLAAGGPSVDAHGLDRDGDGLACEWGAALVSSRRSALSGRAATMPRQAVPVPAAAVPATPVRAAPVGARSGGAATCHTGPRGGTYTITASGNRNYDGC